MLYLAPFWHVLALSVVLTLCKYHVFAQFLYNFMKLGFAEQMFQLIGMMSPGENEPLPRHKCAIDCHYQNIKVTLRQLT